MAEGACEKREIWCGRGAARLYGVACIPEGRKRKPLVIFSHELGNSHTAGLPYAERLAAAGYAAYAFDFRGGSRGANRSGGSSTDMSVITELDDLETVLSEAVSWDFADPDRIILFGGSQGGVVSALTGCRHPDRTAGMILMYPPFMLPEVMREMFPSRDLIPERFDLFGGWIFLGRRYAADVWDMDLYEELPGYPGDVLMLHGDMDHRVDISVSEKAAGMFRHCELRVIKGGKHGFTREQFEEASGHILEFMERYR